MVLDVLDGFGIIEEEDDVNIDGVFMFILIEVFFGGVVGGEFSIDWFGRVDLRVY